MSDPFLGEIRAFAIDYAPRGWAPCDGALLAISQNTALFSLLGITYGGDGNLTFALPDLRGRVALHPGTTTTSGVFGGEEAHALISSEIPAHTHQVSASSKTATETSVTGNVWAPLTADANPFGSKADTTLALSAIGATGKSQPHENRQPYLTLNYCIAMVGIFPSRN